MSSINKELCKFLVAGCSAVSTDLLVYYLLLHWFEHDAAKGISFLSGSVVAYVINKYWTFGVHTRSWSEVAKFSVLYSVTLVANIIVNKLTLLTIQSTLIAFLFATAISTILNFTGQKYWVFRFKDICK